jgi:hypothetical protein
MMTSQEVQKTWAKIVAKSWTDPSFKQKLLKDPNTVLKEFGIEPYQDTSYKIVENTEKTTYLVLPKQPKGELSEEKLKAVTAGGIGCAFCGVCAD